MNRLATYTNSVTTVSNIDGTLKFTQPLKFRNGSRRTIKVVEASITSNIPNIVPENASFAISNDDGVTWSDYSMDTGIYTVKLINLAIQDAIEQETWNTDDSDPVFFLRYNTATTKAYIVIDDTKLTSGNFKIDFNFNGSMLYDVLGFTASTTYGTGTTTAPNYAKVNYQGENVCVFLEGVGNISYLNGNNSNEICRIPMNLISQSGNLYRYPSEGVVSPEITVLCSNEIYQIGIKFKTENDEQIKVFDGKVTVVLQISEY